MLEQTPVVMEDERVANHFQVEASVSYITSDFKMGAFSFSFIMDTPTDSINTNSTESEGVFNPVLIAVHNKLDEICHDAKIQATEFPQDTNAQNYARTLIQVINNKTSIQYTIEPNTDDPQATDY